MADPREEAEKHEKLSQTEKELADNAKEKADLEDKKKEEEGE